MDDTFCGERGACGDQFDSAVSDEGSMNMKLEMFAMVWGRWCCE